MNELDSILENQKPLGIFQNTRLDFWNRKRLQIEPDRVILSQYFFNFKVFEKAIPMHDVFAVELSKTFLFSALKIRTRLATSKQPMRIRFMPHGAAQQAADILNGILVMRDSNAEVPEPSSEVVDKLSKIGSKYN